MRTFSDTAIKTFSGVYFDSLNPENSEVRVVDIAKSLSNQCRFNGHTKAFYSVAQHSVLVSQIVPKEYAIQGLFHDAAEAYFSDIPTPIKDAIPNIRGYEREILKHIFKTLGIEYPVHRSVKEADLILLATEARDLMGVDSRKEWEIDIEPMVQIIDPLSPEMAFNEFAKRFVELIEFNTSER